MGWGGWKKWAGAGHRSMTGGEETLRLAPQPAREDCQARAVKLMVSLLSLLRFRRLNPAYPGCCQSVKPAIASLLTFV